MHDFRNNGQSQQQPQGAPGKAESYDEKLRRILAKAGGQAPVPAQPQTPAQAQAPAPGTSQAPVQGKPAKTDYGARLQAALAAAGKTPAQAAQHAAQQKQAAGAQAAANIVAAYGAALRQDPRKILLLDVEFASAGGADEEIYFKCYADAAGNAVWDLFGIDISYVIPDPIAQGYELYEGYYRGVPDAMVMGELAAAKIHSDTVV